MRTALVACPNLQAEVRAAAASPRLSDESCNRLATTDRNEEVRLAVARNRYAPPTALDLLADGPSAEGREGLWRCTPAPVSRCCSGC